MAATYRQLRASPRPPPRSRRVRVAHLAQPAGPVYDALTRARYIAAHRAAKDRLLRTGDIPGRMAREGIEPVSDRTIREWARREPDLPERLLSGGLARPEDFPRFVRPLLKSPGTAHLAQMRRHATALSRGIVRGPRAEATRNESGGAGLGELFAVVFALWGIGQVIQALGEPRTSTVSARESGPVLRRLAQPTEQRRQPCAPLFSL